MRMSRKTMTMPLLRNFFIATLVAPLTCQVVVAFAPSSSLASSGRVHLSLLSSPPASARSSPSRRRTATITRLYESPSDNDATSVDGSSDDDSPSSSSCWNPNLRKQLAALSSLGALETAYLTYDKIQYSSSGGKASSLVGAFCSSVDGGASSCNDVLHGPYASLHLGAVDVPLSLLGLAAYFSVFVLATTPLMSSSDSTGDELVLDGNNRVALLGGTTLMASFSVYLVSLLLGVIHASCLFCFVSAGLSVSMAALSWTGGMLPSVDDYSEPSSGEGLLELRKKGFTVGASSVGVATVFALGLFLGVTDESANFDTLAASGSSSGSSGTLLASTETKSYRENVPPRITTKSSSDALALASDLQSLNSRMFGAFWCSHCYDQKQSLGYEAMQSIPYVECDREGYNNKRDLCKEREVPGYPTWEIGGRLFPGERSLEELREIVDEVKAER